MATAPAPRALEGLRVVDLATPLAEATGRVLASRSSRQGAARRASRRR
jgi:hypothetical protein